jgi:TctA family transporter
MPTREDWKRMIAPILRGTALGSALGILPGGGAMLSSFAAYSLEKKVSSHSREFGKGAIEGVAAPESANNAGAQASFIPMLTLGIPSNPVMALMIGALIMHGIQPGPSVMTEQPALFWGLVVSMWIGNLFLLVLNLRRAPCGHLVAAGHALFVYDLRQPAEALIDQGAGLGEVPLHGRLGAPCRPAICIGRSAPLLKH